MCGRIFSIIGSGAFAGDCIVEAYCGAIDDNS